MGQEYSMNKREIGFKYENVAKEYLILQGLTFVESNFYTRFGEIDLIFFEKKSQTLVFVEVKYRKNDGGEAEQDSCEFTNLSFKKGMG